MAHHKTNQPLEAWLLEELSCAMGIGKDDLQAMIPYVMSLETEKEARDYLEGLLGNTTAACALVDEFLERKRNTEQRTTQGAIPSKSKALQEQQQPSEKKTKDKQGQSKKVGKKLNNNGIEQLAQSFNSGGSVYRKSDKDDVYIAGGMAQSKGSSSSSSQRKTKGAAPFGGQSTPTPKSTSSPSNTTENQAGTKKKEKKESVEKTGKKDKAKAAPSNRVVCHCMAKVHRLFTNCLKCGKIICTTEGPGPCTFCGSEVESPQQQLELLAREQRDRKKSTPQRRKIPVGAAKTDHTRSYKAKVAGGFAEGWDDPSLSTAITAVSTGAEASDELTIDDEDADTRNARLLAEARKERLLEFDRTSARRTQVIDQASDFALPNEVDDRWLDPEERAQQAALRRQRLEALEAQERRSGKARVITIDISGRCIVEEKPNGNPALLQPSSASSPATGSSKRVPSPVNMMAKAIQSAETSGASKSLTNTLKNPLLTKKMRPVYVKETPPPATESQKTKDKRKVKTEEVEAFPAPEWTTMAAPATSSDTAAVSAFNIRTRHKIGRVQHDTFIEMFS
ncbi:hypothetical protein BDF19DRAFT_425734 [Syncephalis fuscata]|nr:hypothetical protein BDF19DRAFT_425734 [Syncephalis fuscata]